MLDIINDDLQNILLNYSRPYGSLYFKLRHIIFGKEFKKKITIFHMKKDFRRFLLQYYPLWIFNEEIRNFIIDLYIHKSSFLQDIIYIIIFSDDVELFDDIMYKLKDLRIINKLNSYLLFNYPIKIYHKSRFIKDNKNLFNNSYVLAICNNYRYISYIIDDMKKYRILTLNNYSVDLLFSYLDDIKNEQIILKRYEKVNFRFFKVSRFRNILKYYLEDKYNEIQVHNFLIRNTPFSYVYEYFKCYYSGDDLFIKMAFKTIMDCINSNKNILKFLFDNLYLLHILYEKQPRRITKYLCNLVNKLNYRHINICILQILKPNDITKLWNSLSKKEINPLIVWRGYKENYKLKNLYYKVIRKEIPKINKYRYSASRGLTKI